MLLFRNKILFTLLDRRLHLLLVTTVPVLALWENENGVPGCRIIYRKMGRAVAYSAKACNNCDETNTPARDPIQPVLVSVSQ